MNLATFLLYVQKYFPEKVKIIQDERVKTKQKLDLERAVKQQEIAKNKPKDPKDPKGSNPVLDSLSKE